VSELIISVSGLRGVIGESLTPQVAMDFATAYADIAPEGAIVLTRDGRATGEILAAAITSALAALGRDVINVGVAATPTTGVLVRELNAAGGMQISASHNPAEYNGIKLFSSEGRVIGAEEGQKVVERYHSPRPAWRTHDAWGMQLNCETPTQSHLDSVLALVDVDRIRSASFRVLLDSNRGAGSILGHTLLEALGCETILLGSQPDGQFEHTPEPTAENLAGVRQRVTEAGAAVGFCQDPDADRLALIDEQGRYIGEEYTVALCLDHILPERPGPVVINCATSRMNQDIAEKHGCELHRSAVGEANVCDLMQKVGAVFGGEGNGGPIEPRVGYVRDSFVGMALVLDSMAASASALSTLADNLPRYEIEKTKISVTKEKIPAALDALEAAFPEASVSRLDGLRLDWPERWLLVRASNTEPIVRAIAEATTAEQAAKMCQAAADVVAGV